MRPLLLLTPLLGAVLLASCGGGSGGGGEEADALHPSLSSSTDPTSAASTPNPPVASVPDATPGPSAPSLPSGDPAPSTPPAPPSPSDASGPPDSLPALSAAHTCELPDFRQQIMQRVNQARAAARSCGTTVYPAAAPLNWNDKLFAAAAGHAEDMARQQYFSHTSLDGRTLGERVSEAAYVWSAVGENIAAGQRDVDQVVNAWLQSAGHCANIMQARFEDVAVSCVAGSDRPYWVMSLARPR